MAGNIEKRLYGQQPPAHITREGMYTYHVSPTHQSGVAAAMAGVPPQLPPQRYYNPQPVSESYSSAQQQPSSYGQPPASSSGYNNNAGGYNPPGAGYGPGPQGPPGSSGGPSFSAQPSQGYYGDAPQQQQQRIVPLNGGNRPAGYYGSAGAGGAPGPSSPPPPGYGGSGSGGGYGDMYQQQPPSQYGGPGGPQQGYSGGGYSGGPPPAAPSGYGSYGAPGGYGPPPSQQGPPRPPGLQPVPQAIRDHLDHDRALTVQTQYSPSGAGKHHSTFANKNSADALDNFMGGVGGAHHAKDGQPAFEGYYSKAHAGKAQYSVLGNGATGLGAPTSNLDQLGRLAREPGRGNQSALVNTKDGGMAPMAALPDRGVGRAMVGGNAAQDHLAASKVGLTVQEGAPSVGPALRSVQSISSAQACNLGLGHMVPVVDSQRVRQHNGHVPAAAMCNLVASPAGLVQGGQAPVYTSQFAGKHASQLANAAEGMLPAAPNNWVPIAHAGKITASTILQHNGGITSIPAMDSKAAVRPQPKGNGGWATSYEDQYQYLQAAQQQLLMPAEGALPSRF